MCLVVQSCLTLCDPMDWSSPGSSVYGESGDLPDQGIEPRSPALQADSLPSKPPGKTSVIFSEIFPKFIQDFLLLSHSS